MKNEKNSLKDPVLEEVWKNDKDAKYDKKSNKILLKGLRNKLTPKQIALFKLVIWAVLLVWMIFFLAQSILTAQILGKWVPSVFPQTVYYQTLARMIPYWYVFTIGLVEFIIARWAYRKLKGKDLIIRKGKETKHSE